MCGVQDGNFHLVHVRDAQLRPRIELPERFDFIVKQFDADWPAPIGSKHIQDSASIGKFAWQFNSASVVKALVSQPLNKSFYVQTFHQRVSVRLWLATSVLDGSGCSKEATDATMMGAAIGVAQRFNQPAVDRRILNRP